MLQHMHPGREHRLKLSAKLFYATPTYQRLSDILERLMMLKQLDGLKTSTANGARE